jgi:hypothetical protein
MKSCRRSSDDAAPNMQAAGPQWALPTRLQKIYDTATDYSANASPDRTHCGACDTRAHCDRSNATDATNDAAGNDARSATD